MAKDFKIAKTQGVCNHCGQTIGPGEDIIARARLGEEELLREDFHPHCWADMPEPKHTNLPDVLGVWRSRVPQPEEKKKLLIDDALLVNFFQRLEEAEDPDRINFRYVLALILMRKRLLIYISTETDEQQRDIWKMQLRGDSVTQRVIDPKLSEDDIAAVSASLGEIMEGDFE
jgi:hypothetical protein